MTRRWFGGLILVGLMVGCGGGKSSGPNAGRVSRTFTNTYQANLVRKLDILFAVDGSSSMETAQENLRANVGVLVDALEAMPGGMPDVHIAVVSADMGVGHNDIPGCNASGGDNGIFKSGVGQSPLNTCTATNLNAGATYISSTGGQAPQNNFTGNIRQVLQCILPIGGTGCGFEQQLRSIARALGADGFMPPAENQGFLRPEASLAIILLTNEDDCSAANNGFYDVTSNTNLASGLGPPGNFRCSEFGHLCDGMAPARRAPNGAVTDIVTYQNCVSSEGQSQLIPVSAFAAGVKSLKPDPAGQIIVASIQGPSTPYRIGWKTPAVMTDPPWPEILHSCTLGSGTTGTFADPGVRIQQFVQEFGGNGLVYSICQDSFSPALRTIGMVTSRLFPANCVVGTLVDRDGDPANGVQPDCAVTEIVPSSNRTSTIETVVPACASHGNTPPCWALVAPSAGVVCPANSTLLEINRGGATPPDGSRVRVQCQVCTPGIPDPASSCP